MEELLCMMTPYLPTNKPSAPHHLPSEGISRLLDTHFRLLRNDLMGPLFDSIHRMLAKAGGSLTHFLKGPVGTSLKNRAARLGDLPAFYDVTVHDLVVDKIGNLFVIEFAQPEGAGDNKEKLTQYWERSKRLTFGAMVCFLVAQGPSSEIIFATVASRDTDALCFPDRRSASFLWTRCYAGKAGQDSHLERQVSAISATAALTTLAF